MGIVKIDTWLTEETISDDGWATIKPFLFVRLTTDTGHIGWGESFTLPCREEGVTAIIHALGKRIMVDRLTEPEDFRKFVAVIADKHRGLDYSAATSGIEMALWDLKGQIENKPLYDLLGGRCRSEIPLYVNTWSETGPNAEALADRAEKLVMEGYRAVKFYPFQNRTVEEAASCMATIRSRVGDHIDLMLDLASPDDLELSRALAPLIAQMSPYWFEEPVDGDLVVELASIRKETGLRIVTGEKQSGLLHFRDVIRLQAADILNPDIAGLGGILDMMQVAQEADIADITVSPHCWNSMTIAAAAMLHVCSVIPNAEAAEIYPDYIPLCDQFAKTGFTISNGKAQLSSASGLGVEMNVGALSKVAQQKTTRI